MYKACIFDLDGTIADTVESIAYVGNKTLEHFHLPSIPVKDYNFYAGNGADELVRKMLGLCREETRRIMSRYAPCTESGLRKIRSIMLSLFRELWSFWKI